MAFAGVALAAANYLRTLNLSKELQACEGTR